MLLDLHRKPVIEFDATNPQHRKDYALFIQTGNWRHTNTRYGVSDPGMEVQGAIQRKLLSYYTQFESQV